MLAVLLLLTVLSFTAAVALRGAGSRYRSTMQTAGWQEVVCSAEAGADIAVAALQQKNWTNWKKRSDPTGSDVSAPPPASTGSPPPDDAVWFYKTVLSHAGGQGSRRSAVIIEIDAPSGLSDSTGQWYRVRSTGVAELPGSRSLGEVPTLFQNGARQSFSDKLRRLAFTVDHSEGLLDTSRGQAIRAIEVIVKPPKRPRWVRPLTTQKQIMMSGSGSIDSFDSEDPAKSTNGLFDSKKRQSHGNIGTLDSTGSDLRNTYVYGNVQYTGPEPLNTGRVQGTITSPFNDVLDPVIKPSWTVINPTPAAIQSSMTLTGGTEGAPARYKVSELTLSSNNTLTLDTHQAGAESYIEIWVTGKMTISGDGAIAQKNGVHVTYYVEKDIAVTGSGFNNENNVAAYSQIYGVSPASGATAPTLTISGSGDFIGVAYAPGFNIVLSGSGDLSGSFVGKTVSITGNGAVHYDEALGRLGAATGSPYFTTVSWVEDLTLAGLRERHRY